MSGVHTPFKMSNGHGHPSSVFGTNDSVSIGEPTVQSIHDGQVSDGEYDGAGPSTGVNGYARMYVPQNERIIDHLYNAGFQMGEYADTILHANQNVYRLHAIILSRSPYLAHLMSTTPKNGAMHAIYVPLESIPEITDQGFAVALGYLYSSVSLNSLTSDNARAVLAAGCMLGGMDDLCAYAYQACKDSIKVDTINDWIDFVDTLPSASDGSTTPIELPRTTIYGPYAPRLRADVFHFLVVTLPAILDVQQQSAAQGSPTTTGHGHGQGRETLLQIFSRVPFDLFKNAIESPTFQIGSDQERFRFAKAAIDLRKRTRGSNVADETVVLAFGGGSNSGSAVHVTRKMRKRALFKVG